MPSSSSLKADFTLLLVTLLAAAGWIFSKEALVQMPPLTFIAMRFFSSGVILALFDLQALAGMSGNALKKAALSGVCFAVAMLCWISGLSHSENLGVGAFLTSLGVVMVPLMSLLFGDRPGRSSWLALPFAVAGLVSLSLDSAFEFGLAEWMFLTAAVLFALVFILTSRAAAVVPAVPLSSIQLMTVGLIVGPLALMTESWQAVELDIWWWVLASILIATCLRFFLQVWAQGRTSASKAAMIMVLEPVWTAVLAVLWFNESMTLVQVIGCSLIFFSLVVGRLGAVARLLRAVRTPVQG
ncbi:MAG: DMT family transporter [Oceanobacter sp.]